jgi:hypothetical protein
MLVVCLEVLKRDLRQASCMGAPFRIQPFTQRASLSAAADPQEAIHGYFDRLQKLIPTEILGLYLAGQGLIPKDAPIALVLWFIFCIVALLFVRIKGTADPAAGLPPQPKAVAISSVSFVIWVYSLGGPFTAFGLQIPYIASLLVIAWTFLVPYLYKGT